MALHRHALVELVDRFVKLLVIGRTEILKRLCFYAAALVSVYNQSLILSTSVHRDSKGIYERALGMFIAALLPLIH